MNQLHECLDLLRQLVAIPSQSQNEEEHARFIAAYLEDQLGMETELQHVEGKSYNVIGRWPSDFPLPPRKLILGGHLDTVPPSPHWKTNQRAVFGRSDGSISGIHGSGGGRQRENRQGNIELRL